MTHVSQEIHGQAEFRLRLVRTGSETGGELLRARARRICRAVTRRATPVAVASRAVAFVLVALLLGLAPAPAAAHVLHVGLIDNTQAHGSGMGAEQDLVAGTGVHRMREDLRWNRVEPARGTWDWSTYDQLFLSAAQRGMSVLPILDGPPCWAVPAGTASAKCWETYPASDADFAEFAARAAARYGPGGTFWVTHPELDPALAARELEVWNEPYYTFFSNGEVDPERYAHLVHAAVTAGRQANPRTRWLVEANLQVDDIDPDHPGPVGWAQGMVRGVPAIGDDIDGIAVHVYPGARAPDYDGSDASDLSLANARRVYASFVAQGINRPVWITEVGYSSCTWTTWCVPGGTQAAREQLKATWLDQALHELASDDMGYVHAAFVYDFRQWGDAAHPTDRFGDWQGMVDSSGAPLPAYDSFTAALHAFDGTPVPDTSIASIAVDGDSATQTFTATDPSATFTCELDAAAWAPCASPAVHDGLVPGTHTLRVRALGAEAADPTPASQVVSVPSGPSPGRPAPAASTTLSHPPAPTTSHRHVVHARHPTRHRCPPTRHRLRRRGTGTTARRIGARHRPICRVGRRSHRRAAHRKHRRGR